MLFFLRPYPAFWRIAAVAAAGIAATGILSVIAYYLFRSDGTGALFGFWAMLSPLRVLLAPGLALLFLLTGLFAPLRWCRRTLFAATIVELAVFVSVAGVWLLGK